MAQDTDKILPQFINTDNAYDVIKNDETPFAKGLTWDINGNPGSSIGTANTSGEGQNQFVLTPTRSNAKLNIQLPSGWNKRIGYFESKITKEGYYFNYNSKAQHGIYVIDGDTGSVTKVIIDPKLAFSDEQKHAITNRVVLRIVKDQNGDISEKHLMWTDGRKWQGWINVIAAIRSNGFDAATYPYWNVMPPHFDREELLEWVVRKPMVKPVVTPIPGTSSSVGKTNRIVDKNFRFAFAFKYTDGRTTKLSPYSLPLQVKTDDYANSIGSIPISATLKLYAGSPMVEQVLIYVQQAAENSLDSIAVYGDWRLYDTVDKFGAPATGDYWLRTNPWSGLNYDAVFNTFEYVFDNSKTGSIVSQADIIKLQPGIPQVSQAATDIDDAVILCGNRYGYDNIPKDILDQFDVVVKEKDQASCSKPLRTMYLYAYIGMCDADFSYTSQVGYYMGSADTQVRFGGLRAAFGNPATIDVNESKFFKLDFADKNALRVYLKGTPYFADGEWCVVQSDNSITPIGSLYDFTNADTLAAVNTIFKNGGYFICRFKLEVPAGRYIATIGRHNVASSGDYRNTSTYIYGIANSRVKSTTIITGGFPITSLKPNSISTIPDTFSKEMELDCTSQDIDVWGNGKDVFYVYCPYTRHISGQGRFKFIEGYLKETPGSTAGVELFPYASYFNPGFDDWGKWTDKNGFYWGYTKRTTSVLDSARFYSIVDCAPKDFRITSAIINGTGHCINADAYLSDHTAVIGQIGNANRLVLTGTVKDLTGTIGLSNVAISVKDGPTVLTDADGNFTANLHYGGWPGAVTAMPDIRTSNIYVNAPGNYILTTDACGDLPVIQGVGETCIPASQTIRRFVVASGYNLRLQPGNTVSQTSLKAGGKYNVGAVVADLGGRMTFVSPYKEIEVESFLSRNNTKATYLQMAIGAAINFASLNKDFKWFTPYVSKNVNNKRSLQWVGDKLVYLDHNGNVTTDAASATFVKIIIDSLVKENIASNFSLLATYQFVKGDRLVVLDNGDGQLFDIATYGAPIDVQIYGTDYNQAAINAGLLPTDNTNTSNTTSSTEIGLIVKYDARFNRLEKKSGFWIETYTPNQEADVIPYFEIAGFYPIINGKISEFAGYSNGAPVYNNLTTIDLDFWDTYYLSRSILGKYYTHAFESPNVTDHFGANITSGGRINVENKNAAQQWFEGDVIRSDSFLYINGLAEFKEENRKDYSIYPFGAIVSAHTKRNIVAFICTNDWFVAEYNMPYSKVSNGQIVVTNLDTELSLPRQKQGPMYGIEKDDIETIVIDDDFFFWFDRKNTAISKCNYQDCLDISQQQGEERGGIQSYLNMKTWFISDWNRQAKKENRFDVVAGIDGERGNVYFTFRPRRNNTNNPLSYVNNSRDIDVRTQETFVYSIQFKGWLPCVNFTPEGYGRLRGNWANVEMFTFAAGVPYYHNNTENDSYLNFYGIQCEPVVLFSANKNKDAVKIFQSLGQDINGSLFFVDKIFENQVNSFSYIPANRWVEKEKMLYAEILRDMMSYPPADLDQLYRSMLFDGKRIFGSYVVGRLVQRYADLGKYFQLSAIDYLFTTSHPTKP